MTATPEDIAGLPQSKRRGSYPRCLMLTDGAREDVAQRLSALAGSHATVDAANDRWMPRGFADRREARIGKTPCFLAPEQRERLLDWWVVHKRATPPNWDIASTATIDDRKGLILVEAKAHNKELSPRGKAGGGNEENHQRIKEAIAKANGGLNAILPGWALSRDDHYQLANRFAWAWKIASLGIPVILVYLGFLKADEMSNGNREPFADAASWEHCVREHAADVVPDSCWETRLCVGDGALYPLLRTCTVSLPKS